MDVVGVVFLCMPLWLLICTGVCMVVSVCLLVCVCLCPFVCLLACLLVDVLGDSFFNWFGFPIPSSLIVLNGL